MTLLRTLLGCCLILLARAVVAAPLATDPSWLVAQSAQCEGAIAAAEGKYSLPHGLLGSIAKVESGRPISAMRDVRAWPWTIDADGQGLFLDSKAAAVAWVAQAQATGQHHFIDVGCMQVDLPLHPGAFRSLDEAFDPVINADYAARYLRSLHDEAHGDWNVAVGLYHSHTPDLAADYRNRVADVGAGILSGDRWPGAALFPGPAPGHAAAGPGGRRDAHGEPAPAAPPAPPAADVALPGRRDPGPAAAQEGEGLRRQPARLTSQAGRYTAQSLLPAGSRR